MTVYSQARFYLAIDYCQEPRPLLKAADREWTDNLLRDRGRRRGPKSSLRTNLQWKFDRKFCPLPENRTATQFAPVFFHYNSVTDG